MRIFLFWLLLLVTDSSLARQGLEGPTAGVRRSELHTQQFYNKRDPYFPSYNTVHESGHGERWMRHLGILTEVNLACGTLVCLYWDPLIYGDSTTRQYRETTLEFDLGVQIGPYVNVAWSHQSRHYLEGGVGPSEETSYGTTYPLRDSYGVKWCLFGCR